VNDQKPDHFISDCPMAGEHIANLADGVSSAEHPMTLLRMAYGIK
jgi:glycerol-3-phosphate dehydrogenase subunit C